jgi:CDP-glycerol glycerophosphotransferase
MLRARALLDEGKPDEAVAVLRDVVEDECPDYRLWYQLGFALERTRSYEDARLAYTRAIELAPPIAQYHYRRAKVLRALGRDEEAVGDAETALSLDATDPRIHKVRREASAQLPLWRKLTILRDGNELHAGDYWWMRAYAEAAFHMRDYAEAASVYDRVLDFDRSEWRDAVRAYVASARSVHQSRHDTAKIAVTKSKDAEAHRIGIGALLRKMAFRDLAVTAFGEEIERRPSAELFHARGSTQLLLYRWADAIRDLEVAVGLAPANSGFHYRLGLALEHSGDHARAGIAYRESIDDDRPQNHRLYRAAYSLVTAGELEKFARLLSYPYSQIQLADDSATDSGRRSYLSRALDAARAHAESHRDASACSEIAKAYAQFGELGAASEMFDLAVRHSAEHRPDDHLAAAYLRALRGDLSGAADMFLGSRLLRRPFVGDSAAQLRDEESRRTAYYIEYAECVAVDPQTVLLESNHGSALTCNVLPIAREILRDPRFAEHTVVIVADAQGVPADVLADSRVVLVPRGSDLYLKHLATAKWLVNNNTFPPFFSRRDEQRYLNTWHGTPLKTLGKHIGGGRLDHKNAARNFLHATHIAAPNVHTADVLLRDYDIAHLYSGAVAVTGSPRVDDTIAAVARRDEIRARLGVPADGRPVLFYAPTWRGDLANHVVDTSAIEAALAALVAVDGFHVVFRGHPVDEKALAGLSLAGVTVADTTVPTNEILAATDVLVTDYSSVIFDFLPLRRPAVFFTYDIDEYRASRGLAVEPSELSEFVFDTVETLVEGLTLLLYDGLSRSGWRDDRVGELAAPEDGRATRRVVEFFFDDRVELSARYAVSGRRATEVLFFQGSFIPNGITSSFLALTSYLVEQGVGCTVVVEPGPLFAAEDRIERFRSMDPGVRVVGRVGAQAVTPEERWVIDTFNRDHDLASPALWESYWRAFARESGRLFGPASFDVALCFEGYARFWMGVVGATRAHRHGAFLHADMLGESMTRFPYLHGVARQYARYDVLASVSESVNTANSLGVPQLEGGGADHRFVAVPNMMDAGAVRRSADAPLDESIAAWIRDDRFTVVNVGRLSPEKGQERLLDALRALREEGLPIQLLLVGDGPLLDVLQAHARRIGLTDQDVHFAGFVANPFPAMRASDGFVLSSEYEGQGLVVLEALALGVPVMSTDVVGPRGILANGVGRLVENSTEGLRDGMRALATGWRASAEIDFEEYRRSAASAFVAAFHVDLGVVGHD